MWWVYTVIFWPLVVLWPLSLVGGRYQYVRGTERDTWVEFWAVPLALALGMLIPRAARRFVGDRRGRAVVVHGVAYFACCFFGVLGLHPHAPHRWRDDLVLSGVLGPALGAFVVLADRRQRWRHGSPPR
ncbi:hypothetical protein tb265_40660 [Gemmatimonadetes bacterium T265]|nr:hypothetical protein tb265_40660 [Gemmatimonadetes bacterium T265]